MRSDSLKFYTAALGMKQSELARKLGVSRQLVSHWFRQAPTLSINVYSHHLARVAQTLDVSMEALQGPPPLEESERKIATIQLLWDHLYPNLEEFALALNRGNLDALARAVQAYGLYGAEKLAGKKVWKKFPLYKQKIHPAYRKKAEIVWSLCNQTQT
jgi:transcriptional regulator with XRE-family HTH domain